MIEMIQDFEKFKGTWDISAPCICQSENRKSEEHD